MLTSLLSAILLIGASSPLQVLSQRTLPAVGHKPISTSWDVPAVVYTTPASHPCNRNLPAAGQATFAVCITEDETRYKCADSARVLLMSGDGVHHCILFPQQEEETITVIQESVKTK